MSETSTYVNGIGDCVQIGGQWFRRKLRIYAVSITRTAALSAAFSGQIQTEPGQAPFLLESIHIADTADGAANTSQEQFLVQIQDNENGYNWSDFPIPRSAIASDRVFGFQLPERQSIKANTRLTVTITNMAAGPTAGTAIVSLRGWTLIPVQI